MLKHYQLIKSKTNNYTPYAIHTVYSDNENNILDVDYAPIEISGKSAIEIKNLLTTILSDIEKYGVKTLEDILPEYLEEEDTDYEDEYLDEEDKVIDLVDLFNKR